MRCTRPEALLATVTIGACAALAAYWLDTVFRIDEASTIAWYATQPLAVAAGEYTGPNNHVLHTLLVWVAHQLGGWNRVVLRLPAYLAFCLLLPALWCFARREYGATAAAFATVFVGTSAFLVHYATNARGYTLMLLFFAAALLCGQRLVQAPRRTALWAAWAAAVALGLYTVPLMVYPATATGAWMLLARWRRRGRDGFGPFLARTAAWSAAAIALAVVLYLPVFAVEGLTVLRDTFNAPTIAVYQVVGSPREIVEHPFVLWHQWLPIPGWAQGMLLALVAVGAGAGGRSCGRRGTLLLATGFAWGLLFAAHRLLLAPRMMIWALMALLILAGTGAAVVFEGALATARLLASRLRYREAAGRDRAVGREGTVGREGPAFLLRCVSTALLFCALARWTVSGMHDLLASSHWLWRVVPELQMQPGDHFSACRYMMMRRAGVWVAEQYREVLIVKQHHAVEDVSPYLFEWPIRRTSVHRLSSGANHAGQTRAPSLNGPSPGRLFLFDFFIPGRVPCSDPLDAQAGTEWLHDHEQVAAFGVGKVYVLKDWTPSRRPAEDGRVP